MKIGGSIILVTVTDGRRNPVKEAWGSFSEICREDSHNLPYNSMKMKRMPFEYNDKSTGKHYFFEKLEYRVKK